MHSEKPKKQTTILLIGCMYLYFLRFILWCYLWLLNLSGVWAGPFEAPAFKAKAREGLKVNALKVYTFKNVQTQPQVFSKTEKFWTHDFGQSFDDKAHIVFRWTQPWSHVALSQTMGRQFGKDVQGAQVIPWITCTTLMGFNSIAVFFSHEFKCGFCIVFDFIFWIGAGSGYDARQHDTRPGKWSLVVVVGGGTFFQFLQTLQPCIYVQR